MRRLLLAVAVLLTVTPTSTFAGYIIIRVLLEGAGGGGGGDGDAVPGGLAGVMQPPGSGSMGPRPGGSFGTRPGMVGGGPSSGSAGPIAGGMPPNTPPATGVMEHDYTRSIVVVVPLETDFKKELLDPSRKTVNSPNNPMYYHLDTPYYGKKLKGSLFVDSSSIQLYNELINVPTPKKTRHTEMIDRYKAWADKKGDAQALYDAVNLGLRSGFIKEAVAYADELVAAAEGGLALPEREVKPFVAAWAAMQGKSKAVTEPAAQPSDADFWSTRLDYKNVRVVGHYALVYADNPTGEVDRRAAQLNDNFAAFFLWHATRGVVLPVPDKPLVALLAPQGAMMRELRLALDGLPMSDAFYSPDHNLVVLSPERLDDVGQTFLRQNQQVFVKGLNRDQLLAGIIPKADATGEKGPKPDDVARASTLALVEKLAVDEADLAAVSREGTRQLLHTTGTLPRHVTLPSWLSNGAVNFFTRPRGPAYVVKGDDDKPFMAVAITTGYGGPNSVLQRYFRDLAEKKELPADPTRLLENVLADVYFTGIKSGLGPDPAPPAKPKKPPAVAGGMTPMGPRGPGMGEGVIGMGTGGMTGGAGATDHEDPIITLRKKQQRLAIKANATSWALYYYLAKERPAELREYVAELNKLPRDLPVDGKTALAVFVRVFKLSSAPDGTVDLPAVRRFTSAWIDYITSVPSASHDVPLAAPAPKAPPPGGMGPMGGPNPPGGGGPN